MLWGFYMNTSCNLSNPYPEIRVERPSRKSAILLTQFLAGRDSELTAISDYAFQSVITESCDPALSDILECISITEMKHFRILSNLITKLGSPPVLFTTDRRGHKHFWNSSFSNTNTEPLKFIAENIQNEKTAVSNYRQIALQINDRYIREVIERIILDEEHHLKIFSSLIK